MKLLAFLVAAFLLVSPIEASANDRLVTKKSPHSVAATLDKLSGLLTARGIAVVARVDHAAAAQKAGLSLRPTQLLIFGNPKLGTPLMQSNRTIGLDLPMKVLAWEDDKGQVWLAFLKPERLKADHAIADRDKLFQEMSGALEKLSDEAIQPR